MKRPIVLALSICHKDVELAADWLNWTAYLSTLPGGDMSHHELYVVGTQSISVAQWAILRGLPKPPTYFRIHWKVLGDEDERGYPGSASHLFVRTLQIVKKEKPRSATMFCEADTLPLCPEWFELIADEWQTHKKTFMGLYIPLSGEPHMTGNGVYGPNWRKAAPTIEAVLNERDSPIWEKGKGWAWDIYCAKEILKSFHETKLIYQIWFADPWNLRKLNKIPDGAALAHRCKDGTLLNLWTEHRDHGEFWNATTKPGRYFMLNSPHPTIAVDTREFTFTSFTTGFSSHRWCFYEARTFNEASMLGGVASSRGVEEISREDYEKLEAQMNARPPKQRKGPAPELAALLGRH